MTGIGILNLILQRSYERLNRLEWVRRKQALQRSRQIPRRIRIPNLPAEERAEPWSYFWRKGQKTPLFGVSQDGFATDWAQTRSIEMPPQGMLREDVPRVIKTNRGSTVNLKPLRTYGRPESQFSRRTFPTERTNIKAMPRGGSTASRWDGKVRNVSKKKDYLSNRTPGEQTPGMIHAQELKTWPYDFSQ